MSDRIDVDEGAWTRHLQRMEQSRRTRRRSPATTLGDVARTANVSPMTVSRVVAGVASVDPELRARVDAAIAKTGYALNVTARALASGGGIRIGVLYGNPSAGFTSEMLVALLEEGSEEGIHFVLRRVGTLQEAFSGAEQLIAANCHGIILPTPYCDKPSLRGTFERAGLPTLGLGTGELGGKSLSVTIDNREAAHRMTRHLIDEGHRDIAFILGHEDQPETLQRFNGFREAMSEANLVVRDECIARGDFSYRSGLVATDSLLSLRRRPTAIFASNDDMAAGAVATAHRLGFDVPVDISIAGFDDTALASSIWPALTTIRQPVANMASRALRMMIDVICGRERSSASCPSGPLELIVRQSVGPRHPER